MLRTICCRDRSRLDTGWLIGSSLAAVAATFVLTMLGADLHAHAMIYAAFPMAMLVSDRSFRRLGPTWLILRMTVVYGAMLGVARLAEAI